jgi:hypothetical protein
MHSPHDAIADDVLLDAAEAALDRAEPGTGDPVARTLAKATFDALHAELDYRGLGTGISRDTMRVPGRR